MIKVMKRQGFYAEYDSRNIIRAVSRAMAEGETGVNDTIANDIEKEIYDIISQSEKIFNVEEIQDLVENLLMKHGRYNTAKRYIKYRTQREVERKQKWVMNDLQYDIWHQKYENNEEGFDGWIDRISAGNEKLAKLIRQKKFLFGGRILSARGLQDKRKITFSNCYVIAPPEDNLESIFESAKKLARTFSYGGGCGIDIGKLRPSGSLVNNCALTTTGATSFMDLYSKVTEVIGQKGRRGALMISIPCNHPDLEEFIDIKKDLTKITKANISIRFNNEFMECARDNKDYILEFKVEDTGEIISKKINAQKVFMKFCEANWDTAEPGALYWTKIEDWNLLSNNEEFEFVSVNPCAEEPLPAGGSCLLGSLNLSEFVAEPFTSDAYFDFEKFEDAVKIAIIGLNEVLDEGLTLHPLKEQQDSVKDWRQIGLGIFGLHDMLIKLGIRYGSDKSIAMSNAIGLSLVNEALKQSALLAKDYGTYPKYNKDVMDTMFFKANANLDTKKLVEEYGLRNSQLLTIAPTGSLSTMLGVSGGIEPIYQISYTRKTETLNDGEDSFYKVFTPIAKQYMEAKGLSDESQLPQDLFVTAMTLDYEERLKMQAIWQKHIDASISSTVNVPITFTVKDTFDLYVKAWEYGLKGVTIFRDGCRRLGVLGNHNVKDSNVDTLSAKELKDLLDKRTLKELLENPNKCPHCGGDMLHSGGCKECIDCGYSPCSL